MPQILFIKGYKFFFYSNECNEPQHIHVKKGDGRAKIWLFPEVKVNYFFKFKQNEEKQIFKIVSENQEFLKSKWYEYFRK